MRQCRPALGDGGSIVVAEAGEGYSWRPSSGVGVDFSTRGGMDDHALSGGEVDKT